MEHGSMIAGLVGGLRNGSAALADHGALVGVCAQERVTRVRSNRATENGMPDLALDFLLRRQGRSRNDIGRYVMAQSADRCEESARLERIDPHFAHACTAYLTSPFASAAVVVCDHEAPFVSVWHARGAAIERVEWPWNGPGFSDVLRRFAIALGFRTETGEYQLEALARLRPDSRDSRIDALVTVDDGAIAVDPSLDERLVQWLAGDHDAGSPQRAHIASALQLRLGDVFLELLASVRSRLDVDHLCLGGSLFYHSSVNTLAKQAGVFTDVFVPIDPGRGGLSVGAALHALGKPPQPVSPFLGPSYSAEETKRVLDNCKLNYSWESEGGVIKATVDALQQGRLVGWFDGSMEWGPRALGARCILANPSAPYVLENLNLFLKRREPWRGYSLSGLKADVAEHLDGPASAPFMECDYRPRDPGRFRHVLPSPEAAIRVQTVAGDGLPRFTRLLEACGEATGLPFVINTSFNGFHEPIVCSPRDAVRVFYGSGLDLLVVNQFLLRK
jgi:carbamoyltransferase